MSNDNKSESINFENEQIGQRTLNSDEERKIKKREESKGFTTSNNFNKKGNIKKNKSQNKFHRTKLPPISKPGKEPVYSSQRENTTSSVFSTSYSNVYIDPRDNYQLYIEMHKAQKEMKNINRELKNLQKEFNIIEESNITNKYIIEKILNMQEDDTINDNNDKIEEEEIKNNEKEEDEKDIYDKNKSKKIKVKNLKYKVMKVKKF